MDATVIRKQLHEYIDIADQKHLEAIFVLVEKEIESGYEYDDATIKMLQERRQNHLSGKSKSYSVEESMKMIRQHKK